jgi:glycosyltransferase involved in cell wall biosynthesis
MKICFLAETYPPYEGGSETFLYDLIQEMKKKNEIILITRSHPSAMAYEKEKNLQIYRVYNFPLPRIHKYFVMGFVCYLKAREVAKDCDVINVQNISPWLAGHLLKRQFDIPYIQTLEAIPSAFVADLARFIYRNCLKMSNFDKLVVWTEELKKTLEKYGLNAIVIEGGVNTEKFSPKISGVELKKKYGRPLIVTAKPLYKNNALGISYLIEAMRWVDARLLIVGDGEYRKWLENLVKELNLTNKVFFAGSVKHDLVPMYFAAADVIANSIIFDIGVRPSLSLLESMAMGKPVLLTKNFESGEMNNKNLCLAKIGDSKDIAKKINLLLRCKKYAKRIGKNARKIVEKKYSIEIVANKLLNLYESLI